MCPISVTVAPVTGLSSGPTTVPTIGGAWGSAAFAFSGVSATSYVTWPSSHLKSRETNGL